MHVHPRWDGKAARKKGKGIKDLHQLCGDIFYLISLLRPTHCLRPYERKAFKGPYGAITEAGPGCALSRGLSCRKHAMQAGARAPCPGGPRAKVGCSPPSSLSLAREKTCLNHLCELLLSLRKQLSPASSFPAPVPPTHSHIPLLVATRRNRPGK